MANVAKRSSSEIPAEPPDRLGCSVCEVMDAAPVDLDVRPREKRSIRFNRPGPIFGPQYVKGVGAEDYIACGITETYGGKIRSEKPARGGVVFRFNLPLAETQLA